MSGRLIALVCCLSFAAQARELPRVVVTGLTAPDAATQKLADSLADSLLTELARSKRVQPMGPSDLTSVLGLERQKQLLGCSDGSTSCLAELTAAMGAPWVVTGSLLRAGKSTRIDLKLVRTKDGSVSWRNGRTLKEDSELFDAVTDLVKELLSSTDFEEATRPAGEVASSSSAAPAAPWLIAGIGGAVLVAGAIITGIAGAQWSNVQSTAWRNQTGWETIRDETQGFNRNIILGPVLLSAGFAAALGGVIWGLVNAKAPTPAVTFVPTLQGVSVRGVF